MEEKPADQPEEAQPVEHPLPPVTSDQPADDEDGGEGGGDPQGPGKGQGGG
jgi:hypothetical protein